MDRAATGGITLVSVCGVADVLDVYQIIVRLLLVRFSSTVQIQGIDPEQRQECGGWFLGGLVLRCRGSSSPK